MNSYGFGKDALALASVQGGVRPAIFGAARVAMVLGTVVAGCSGGETAPPATGLQGPAAMAPPTAQPNGAGAGPGTPTAQPGPTSGGGPNPDVVMPVGTDKQTPVDGMPVASGSDWCAARQVLQANCGNCHGAEPAFGAPMSLVSHADLMAPSPVDGREAFKVVVDRIDDGTRPMPPSPNPRLSDTDRAVLTSWAAAGAPTATCDNTLEPEPVEDPNCIDCGDYACKDGTPLRFLAHGQPSAGDTTPFDGSEIGGSLTVGDPNLYECFFFKAPWGQDAVATGFKPVIDNKRIMHHWLLYASENAPFDITDGGMKGECQLQSDPNRILLGGWAPGTPGRNFPANVGQELPFGPNTYLTLEMHYYNTQPGMPALDRSGAEICLASSPRPDVATQHWLGTEKIAVPAGGTADASDVCTPSLSGDQTSTLLAVTPHMHSLGRHAKLEILRGSGEVEVIHDAPFAADNQTTYVFDPPIVVHSDDKLRATCSFQNPTDAPVAFGEGSQEEMCYFYTTAYPAGSLANGKTGCFGPFCTPGGVRRCIDNENLIDIIGGL